MPFRVTNISNEILNTKTEYNKVIVIDDIAIQPGQSQFYGWTIVPTNVNILRLQNLVNVEAISINDYGVLQQEINVVGENKEVNEIVETPIIDDIEESFEVPSEIINEEEPIIENIVEEVKVETKPKATRKKKTEK